MIILSSRSVWTSCQPGLQIVSASSVNGNLGYFSELLWLHPSLVYYSIPKPLLQFQVFIMTPTSWYQVLLLLALTCPTLPKEDHMSGNTLTTGFYFLWFWKL